MKRALGFIVLLMFVLTPLVRACVTPGDFYAVEVVLNKPGISQELWRLEIAHNVLVENGTFVFRSHYDGRLYVLVWNASDGVHLRVGIPLKWVEYDLLRSSFNVSLMVTDDAIGNLTAYGWKTDDNTTFSRGGVTVALYPLQGGECTSDGDCATGGCSGEVCAPREEAGKIVTSCVYRSWYGCLSLTSCGCVNGLCTWKPNPAFEKCLREHGVDPSKVIRAGRVEVDVVAVNNTPDEAEASVKDFLSAFGVTCNPALIFVEDKARKLAPTVDPGKVNASEAVRAELEWMRESGIVNLSESDVEEISTVARWGFAGHNSRIGWYETKNGTFSWIPYQESRDPKLVRCASREIREYRLPSGTAYIGPTPTKPSNSTVSNSSGRLCGPGLVLLLVLLPLMAGKR